ncbi:MFS transporter [Saccharibacillus sp. CPCC 101409]|uniref:MFS transporter n=1 Tax=Saccharibacillus sp. CPCC 101409 TaxID=3058041 RepID=UPI0026738689|nr:MFS transporter [Saccharibacillus sp. CPCC 101409]MDO3409817.1 MFS transporter [Saccharibacillus sp. CPCC 101409]
MNTNEQAGARLEKNKTEAAVPVRGAAAPADIPAWLLIFLAAACGIIVANLYYAQPLVEPIRQTIGLSAGSAGLIVTLTQIGYAAGLLLLVPLGDILENRRLVASLLLFTVLALTLSSVAGSAPLFLLAAMLIGLGSVAAQILVPYASHLASDENRGRVVGNVMSGLTLGIMLARPVSSLLAGWLGWRSVFAVSAALILTLALVLLRVLPARRPQAGIAYPALLRSMGRLLLTAPVLRRRALYHACMFGAFSLFWTTAPLLLGGPVFHFTQTGIALFALVGVAGAVAAPIAGRVADRGLVRPATGIALAMAAVAALLPMFVQTRSVLTVGLLLAAAVLLDFGVSANLILSQREIFAIGAEYRSRLNGLFMAIFFLGGAAGSAVGAWAFAAGGWKLAMMIAAALPLLALGYYGTESRVERRTERLLERASERRDGAKR